LYLIAKLHGITLQRIRHLNPYHGDLIYPGQNLVVHRSVFDTGLNHIPYKILDGDTVGAIAEKFGVSVASISEINTDIDIDVIYAGQKINVLADFTEHRVMQGDTLFRLAERHNTTVEMIKKFSGISSNYLRIGQFLNIPTHEQRVITRPQIPRTVELHPHEPTATQTTYIVRQGDTAWDIAIRFGIPILELMNANDKTGNSRLTVGETLRIPVHHIPRRETPGRQFGEHLDRCSAAQYLFPINQTAVVLDYHTETTFRVRRTSGANHADCEPLTARDTEIAMSIFGGHSREPRPVIILVGGRRIAASMSFYPHGVQYIGGNNFDGHFDVHFLNSSWHNDGRVDTQHQESVRIAAGR
jgi:LysM repeat protein